MQQSDVHVNGGDELLFSDDDEQRREVRAPGKWRLLIVDDEPDIHSITRMVLDDYVFEGRSLEFLSAYTGEESLKILRETPDIAVVLLDVVMETNSAGLDVAVRIRNELENDLVRIILRTGQPGAAPEHKVITELDINDYRQKTELTSQRLSTSVTTALRSYRDLRKIEENKIRLAQLAMSVAHQIRNRTMTINGFVNIASRKLEEESPVREYLGTISEEAARLEGIVESVSDFAGIDHFGLSEVNVRTLLSEQLEELKYYADEKSVDLQSNLNAEDRTISCKPDFFSRAVKEICRNSVDFSRQDQVDLDVYVSCDDYNCYIELEDNGIGITEEDLPYIFDPFFTSKPEGVGMGLSIVQRIASEYSWVVEVESEKGKGTKVLLAIPFSPVSGSQNE